MPGEGEWLVTIQNYWLNRQKTGPINTRWSALSMPGILEIHECAML